MKGPELNPLFSNGILLVDKPQDWTSHDVCQFVKRRFNIKKVGHAGTLDPIATGLLVLLIGKATKLSNQLTGHDKTYEGVMKLGEQSDSHDRTGKITGEASWESITLEKVQEQAKSFTGTITQIPPMVSALKQKGVRLYQLARKGKEVPREGREVTVHSFDFFDHKDQYVSFRTKVSKGTYVRTLIHDLGQALESAALLQELRRTDCGDFSVTKSVSIDELKNNDASFFWKRVIPMTSIPSMAEVS